MKRHDPESLWNWCKVAYAEMSRNGAPFTRANFRKALKHVGAPFESETPLVAMGIRWEDWRRKLQGLHVPEREELGVVMGSDLTPAQAWEAHSRASDAHMQSIRKKTHHVLEIEGGGPFGLLFLGDAHLGNLATDYARLDWVAKVSRSKKTPLKILGVGDFLDNMFWLFSEVEKNGKIANHVKMAVHFLQKTAPAWGGMCGGNHDDWTKRKVGIDILDHTMAKAGVKIPYHPTELLLDIEHGDVSYRGLLRHELPGKSQDWPAHGALRWLLRHDTHHDLDFVAGGHTHSSDAVSKRLHGKIRHGIQLGAYKLYEGDMYARVRGFPDTNESPDMLAIIYPDRKEMRVYKDTEEGLWILERRRREWGKGRKEASRKTAKASA